MVVNADTLMLASSATPVIVKNRQQRSRHNKNNPFHLFTALTRKTSYSELTLTPTSPFTPLVMVAPVRRTVFAKLPTSHPKVAPAAVIASFPAAFGASGQYILTSPSVSSASNSNGTILPFISKLRTDRVSLSWILQTACR